MSTPDVHRLKRSADSLVLARRRSDPQTRQLWQHPRSSAIHPSRMAFRSLWGFTSSPWQRSDRGYVAPPSVPRGPSSSPLVLTALASILANSKILPFLLSKVCSGWLLRLRALGMLARLGIGVGQAYSLIP